VTCTDPRTGVTFNATIIGTEGPDVIWATAGSVVATLGGDDTVYSDFAGPNVVACLGDGADSFWPSVLGNVVQGSFGVRGGNGRDVLMGGSGNDYLIGDAGNDALIGGPGTDIGDGGLDVDQSDVESRLSCEF
jgi:Ca2+-binding RTX toxin-like protein